MVDIISAGGIILNEEGEVALVQNRKGKWGFPKGHLEDKETPLMAARREIYEEAGIEDLSMVKRLGLLEHVKPGHPEYQDTGGVKYILMYLFKSTQEQVGPTDEEITRAEWVPLDQVLDLLHYAEDKRFFQEFKEKI
jgi:tRNA nucleotidyltransferase (CCA-adding enzyme)